MQKSGGTAVLHRARHDAALLTLPLDVLHKIMASLHVSDLRSWKPVCSFAAKLGRACLMHSKEGPACITREVASAVDWADMTRRKRARELFSANAAAFIHGLEFWPRETIRDRGVPLVSDLLRYISRTRAPIGSDVGLQVLISVIERHFGCMHQAWLLLPAAMRRSGRPGMAEFLPFLEQWASIEQLSALLMHDVGSMLTSGHMLIRHLMEHWPLASMAKAAAVTMGIDDRLAPSRLVAHKEINVWRIILLRLRGHLQWIHGSSGLWEEARPRWNAFFAAARCIAEAAPSGSPAWVAVVALSDPALVEFPEL